MKTTGLKSQKLEVRREKGKPDSAFSLPPSALMPKLRFPEFQGAEGWKPTPLDRCLDYLQPTPYLVADTKYSPAFKTPVLTAGKTFILGYTDEEHGIFSKGLPVIIFDDFTTATQFVDFPFKAKSSAMKILQAKNGADIKFMYETLQTLSYEVGAHERHWISNFAPMLVPVPKPAEQQKIAECLSSLDALIAAETQKLEALKTHKKGLMQQLFPREGETLPKLRFPEFQGAEGWKPTPLDRCLDYLQPTPYLVADTKYSPAFKTPVLTAGKTFILGYTDEEHGIFSKGLPVIIFDDFTTATQFVDFPFKAKSSAMKILQAKNGADIKFMYETLQTLSYEVGAHERHWISNFAPMLVPVPKPAEQQKIAECLSSLDALIAAETQKLEALKTHKKGIMQQLFPSANF